jgi:Protein of unknown function (DUF3179)
VVCNSGTSLVPTINGKMHHFNNVGLYDALFVMQDTESKTLWRHIDGEALYGPMVGRTLGPVGNLLQMNVQQALAGDPQTRVAISDQPYVAGGKQFGGRGGIPGGGGGGAAGPAQDAKLMDMFAQTLGKEDTRRPRMELGLGIWTSKTRRYYAVAEIRKRGRAFMDRIDGKGALIYIDPETNNPAALFVNAKTAKLESGDVRLDTGAVVRSGVLLDRGGRVQKMERPQQIFTRWYGFALSFPGADIFGQSPNSK